MITRAYKKNMVVIKNIESDTVEEAYLFIREDAPSPDESELVKEAGRIIRACGVPGKKRMRISSSLLWFLAGMTGSSVILLILYYLIM